LNLNCEDLAIIFQGFLPFFAFLSVIYDVFVSNAGGESQIRGLAALKAFFVSAWSDCTAS
jgi:hypothetical protein